MIEVNLLPEDRRPVERTPLPRFLTILGGVIGFCIEGIFIVFLLTLIPRKRADLETWKRRQSRAQEQVNSVKQIEKEIKQISERKIGVEKLQNDRRLWAPILYRLCDPDVLPLRVWYTELALEQGRASRGKQAPEELMLEAFASSSDAGDGAARVATAMTFVENLRKPHAQFSENFSGPPVLGKMVTQTLRGAKDDEEAPKVALSFSVKMPLKLIGAAGAKKR
jgi:Tfp pilus assembly protein PilN